MSAGLWLSAITFLGYLLVPSFGALLAARVAQGIAAGLVYGAAPALVTLSTPRERHGIGLGLMSFGMGAGSAVGPVIGGLLVAALGWRAVFVFRAPVAALIAVLAWFELGRGRAPSGWRLPLASEVFRWPVMSALTLVFLAYGAQFTVWLLVPFYLMDRRALSSIAAGLVFMLTPLTTALAAPAAGWLTDCFGRRWPMVMGLTLEALGLGTVSLFAEATSLAPVAVGLAMIGLGLGVFQVPNLAHVMASFPAARQGAAGGLAFMFRTLGVVAGVQLAAAVFGSREAELGFAGAFRSAFAVAAVVCGIAALIASVPTRTARPTAG